MHLPYSAPYSSKQDNLEDKGQETQTSAEHLAVAEASLSIGRVRPGMVSYGRGVVPNSLPLPSWQ